MGWAGRGVGRTLICDRVAGVRVTPISGSFFVLDSTDGALITGAVSVSGAVVVTAAEGTVAGGVVLVAEGTAVDDVVGVVGSTTAVGLRDWPETRKTADTTIAITATAIAPIAVMAWAVRYQGTGLASVTVSETPEPSLASKASHR